MLRFRILCFFLLISAAVFSQKTITLRVAPDQQLTIDGITVYKDNLPKELQQRLWRSYMSNGKMPATIYINNENQTNQDIHTEINAAIKEAQEKTLTVLSLHKHKKRFDDISTQKKEKIRKQFPVLFQEKFHASPLLDQR